MAEEELSIDDIAALRICAGCIGESYLKAEIEKDGEEADCHYCKTVGKTITIEDLSHHIEYAFETHYRRTPVDPSGLEYAMMKEGGWWERHGEPAAFVIAEAAYIDDEPAEHVRNILDERTYDIEDAKAGEESPFDEDAHYEEQDVSDIEFQMDWRFLQDSLETEARLFNRSAEYIFNSIFEGLSEYKTFAGKTVVVDIGPGCEISELYRARVFQSDAELEQALARPDLEIGPPPSSVAIAGRMNPKGIAVFYGALDAHTTIAEIRPPVGSRVVVGRFTVTRPLRLLDVAALRAVAVSGSIFDPAYIRLLERRKFFQSLSARITMPVMPDDEPIDYIVTQAIAEYLANVAEPKLDGIIYPSVQTTPGARNVVLFHSASRVEMLEIPDGTDIDANLYTSTDEGPEIDYRVWERTPKVEDEIKESEPDLPVIFEPMSERNLDPDSRERSLRLEVEKLKVYHINHVSFDSTCFGVNRCRTEKWDVSPF